MTILFMVSLFQVAQAESYPHPAVGETIYHKAAYEDTLVQLARDHDLGFVEVRAANPFMDQWIPGEGTEILLPAMHILPKTERRGIVINLPEMRLYYYPKDGGTPVTHPLGIGREGLSTPTGKTKVTRKAVGPTWRPTKRMREEDPDLPASVPPGSDNPLGTHALYLGWPEYAIHGTNRPFGIGRRVSSGCIRLYPEDIQTFYDTIPVGTLVTVVDQPIKAAWIGDTFHVEAHATMGQAGTVEEGAAWPSYEMSEADWAIIRETAGKDIASVNWNAVREAIRGRRGYPVEAGKREK